MVRRWVLNFLEYVGRRWVPTMMRWLARDRADLIRPAPGAPAWQDTGGSPLTIWLMAAAKRRSFESPTMQRDLNAGSQSGCRRLSQKGFCCCVLPIQWFRL